MCGLTLQAADAIVQGALAKARELKCKPMTVAVVDAGGAAIVMKREDGSGALRPDIAFAKAWGPIGMGIGGRAMAKRANDTPTFWAALNTISDGRIAPVAGGVLILKDGKVLGSRPKSEKPLSESSRTSSHRAGKSASLGTTWVLLKAKPMTVKVAIIYYSATGTTYQLALAVAESARQAGAEVRFR